MIKEPFIVHSEITNEIYIVCGTEKYPVTEQVIKAMQNTGRLTQPSDDCISRKRIKEIVSNITAECDTETIHIDRLMDEIDDMPPVTPTHGTCKDCNDWDRDNRADGACYCDVWRTYTGYEFYCGDYVGR